MARLSARPAGAGLLDGRRRAFASVPGVAFLGLAAYVRFSTPAAASLVGCYALTADGWQSVFSAGPPEVVVLEPGPEAPGTSLLGASDDRPMQLLGKREGDDWERSGWQRFRQAGFVCSCHIRSVEGSPS